VWGWLCFSGCFSRIAGRTSLSGDWCSADEAASYELEISTLEKMRSSTVCNNSGVHSVSVMKFTP